MLTKVNIRDEQTHQRRGLEARFFVENSEVMNIMILLIGASLLIALFFLAAFIWAVRSGQYDDDYTPSMRILLDDAEARHSETEQSN